MFKILLSILESIDKSAIALPSAIFLPKWKDAILIFLSARIFERSLMKPGLSSLIIYKLCAESSALILIPLISTILGFPPKIVPQTDRVCFSCCNNQT